MRNRGNFGSYFPHRPALLATLGLCSTLLLSSCGSHTVATNTSNKGAPTMTNPAHPNNPAQSSFDFPVVEGAIGHAPTIIQPKGTPPQSLEIEDLVLGSGDRVAPTSTVTVHYLLMAWKTGAIIDSSWSRGAPSTFGLNQVIPGWQQGMPGMKVGGRRELLIPPSLGYGDMGSGPVGPKETLIFVVDLIAVK